MKKPGIPCERYNERTPVCEIDGECIASHFRAQCAMLVSILRRRIHSMLSSTARDVVQPTVAPEPARYDRTLYCCVGEQAPTRASQRRRHARRGCEPAHHGRSRKSKTGTDHHGVRSAFTVIRHHWIDTSRAFRRQQESRSLRRTPERQPRASFQRGGCTLMFGHHVIQ